MSDYTIEKPVPFYDQIYNSIKQMIVQGVIEPGERIYETKIARDFNVSRSPVREAVRALEKEGLLFIDDKSRITVYKPSMKDVDDIYQCRMVLESLAARLTTQHATNRQLKEIETTLVKTKKYVEQQTTASDDAVITLNSKFHDLIVQHSQNRRLQKQLSDLRSLTFYYRVINFQGEGRQSVILDEHLKIFEAIKRRDEEQAASLMAGHIMNDLNHLKQIFNI